MTPALRNIRASYTFRLRKDPPTFIEGAAGLLDVSGKLIEKYNTDETDEIADFNALNSDWRAVGKDMYSALDIYGKQTS